MKKFIKSAIRRETIETAAIILVFIIMLGFIVAPIIKKYL